MAATVSKEYANGDGYFQIHFLMMRAHETLLKGLHSVISQTSNDHTDDLHNWLGYVSSWASCVHHHHSIEEKGLDVNTELEQHAKLHSDLETLTESLHKWQVDPETYDKERLRSILDDLSPNFREHLKKEVDHLSKDRLVEHISSQELKDCIAKLEEEAKKGDPFVDPVFMMSHTPPEHKYWSNMGWFMYKVLIPALSYRHYGYWKYSPETLNI